MRKLAILTILAVPVSALGAYALAATDDHSSPEKKMIVNEADKSDLAPSASGIELFAMDDSDDDETEAGPLRPHEFSFDDDDDHEEHHDDDGDEDHDDDD